MNAVTRFHLFPKGEKVRVLPKAESDREGRVAPLRSHLSAPTRGRRCEKAHGRVRPLKKHRLWCANSPCGVRIARLSVKIARLVGKIAIFTLSLVPLPRQAAQAFGSRRGIPSLRATHPSGIAGRCFRIVLPTRPYLAHPWAVRSKGRRALALQRQHVIVLLLPGFEGSAPGLFGHALIDCRSWLAFGL